MTVFMKKMVLLAILILLSSCSGNKLSERKPYKEESNAKIGRGITVFERSSSKNYITWRKLPNDQEDQNYYLWRKNSDLSEETLMIAELKTTNFIDSINANGNMMYAITVTFDEKPSKFENVTLNNNLLYDALVFNIGVDYKQARVVTGDLTGDGELDVLILYSEMQSVDPFEKAWIKSTNTFKLAAFQKNGNKIWEIDLGFGIEAGYPYAPVSVWDLNADGKCEVILKTNKSNDPKNYNQEYITVLKGENGEIIREARWPDPPSGNYNSDSRNFINIAHLDGINPSIIISRGIYFKQLICAYDIELNELWRRYIGSDIQPKYKNRFLRKIWSWYSNDQSRGSHSVPIADIDENGTEEILWGEHVITEDGEDLWKVEEKVPYYGHLDIVYAANMIDSLPGKEIYYGREGWADSSDNIGMLLVNSNGNTIWSKWGYTHIDGGWAAPIRNLKNDWQFFGYDVAKKNWTPGVFSYDKPAQQLFDKNGNELMYPDSSWIGSLPIDWDGDGIKEIYTKKGEIKRYNGENLKSIGKGILWGGDLYGDHREELVFAPLDGKIYIIFNTNELAVSPKITKIADRQYRNDLSRTMIYYVVPTESGYIPINKN